ncbi:unnamed protein product [Staurois parvus]|uniref:Uncharacterized protein n=1 Tax=Staurois parvus TaxID=386267 RepID=A0ABN9EVI7_9NEOB|nr:unnamed protein product [Staurois parvus]
MKKGIYQFIVTKIIALPCVYCGRPDIVNAGSGRPDIVNAGSGETRYSECRVGGDQI